MIRLISITILLLATLAPGSIVLAQGAASNARLDKIRARGTIVIGLQKDYHPFHIENANKDYPGIDMELARLLAKTLKVKLDVRFHPLATLIGKVESGQIDVSLGGVSSSLSRSNRVRFSTPYIVTTPAGLLSRTVLPPESESVDFPRKRFRSLGDLRQLGKLSVGVKQGTTNERILRRDPDFKRHTIATFPTNKALLDALQEGKVDVLIADGVAIRSMVLKRKELTSRFLPLLKRYREEHICMVLPRGDAELWLYLNFFVREVRRSGRLGAIQRRYFEGGEWIPKGGGEGEAKTEEKTDPKAKPEAKGK